jgi:hypothetical protein
MVVAGADGFAPHDPDYTAKSPHQRKLDELRWTLLEDEFEIFLYEVVVVDENFRNPLATHRRH